MQFHNKYGLFHWIASDVPSLVSVKHLIECLVDSGETEEAASFAKVTEEFINAHIPALYPRLFALLVQHKLTQSDVLKEKSRQGATLEVIYRMQGLKDGGMSRVPVVCRFIRLPVHSDAIAPLFGASVVSSHQPGPRPRPLLCGVFSTCQSSSWLFSSSVNVGLMTQRLAGRSAGGVHRLEEINGVEPTEEELQQVLRLLTDRTGASAEPGSSGPLQSPTAVPPADRVPFLLELALLAVRAERHGVAVDCLKELRSAGEAVSVARGYTPELYMPELYTPELYTPELCTPHASAGQRALMECVNVEIKLRRRRGKMNDYSKASVEVLHHMSGLSADARLKEVGQLDRCLQSAVREGDHQGAQAVCAQQWSCCLPLLQHNLRTRIRTPLLRVARALEDIQSALLETRCQVHSELAALEEEAGRLEAALTHLQKAALLDDGTRRRRLSSALRLLRLRGALDPAAPPPRAEDEADSLVQQRILII
ncbi:Cilia- and flagella-associated protein 46 [Liparis tanakae]|uniref:Cilia-and flagella-associated protein 46 n=1 Tax=Liparis tanakae TaxID=230148 RepID=A0A4Z2FJH2_9TELE|nr:Cilia- and flagella-associated protein 46 [Liparis tanakae]